MPGPNRRAALACFGLALGVALVLFGLFLIRSDARASAERQAIRRELRELRDSVRELHQCLHPGHSWPLPSGAD